jgi:hypothetical protein
MPITDQLGFVIEQPASAQNSESMRSVAGYFVVRYHDGWLRLDSMPQMALLDWPLRSSQPEKQVLIAPGLAFVIEQPKTERGDGRTPAAVGYFVAERGALGATGSDCTRLVVCRSPDLRPFRNLFGTGHAKAAFRARASGAPRRA